MGECTLQQSSLNMEEGGERRGRVGLDDEAEGGGRVGLDDEAGGGRGEV